MNRYITLRFIPIQGPVVECMAVLSPPGDVHYEWDLQTPQEVPVVGKLKRKMKEDYGLKMLIEEELFWGGTEECNFPPGPEGFPDTAPLEDGSTVTIKEVSQWVVE